MSLVGSGNKCHNGGQCVEGRGLDFTCDCAAGWKGRFCSIEIDECESSPCLNGGICVDKLAAYACVCAVGFTGTNCEEDIEVCNDSPCKNSALCLMEEGQPVCYCVPDFHGEKCEYQYDECEIGPRLALEFCHYELLLKLSPLSTDVQTMGNALMALMTFRVHARTTFEECSASVDRHQAAISIATLRVHSTRDIQQRKNLARRLKRCYFQPRQDK